MAITQTPRLGITRWSAGTDPFRRSQVDADNSKLEQLVAIYDQGIFNDRPPAGVEGRFYLATDTTPPRMFYDNGAAWVEPGAGLAQAANLPATFGTPAAGASALAARADHVHRPGFPGEIKWGPWDAAPAGTFLADGSLKNRADEPDLFAAVGTKFNTGGELATQFRLPNIKGRTVVGRDTGGAPDVDFDTVGEVGGAKTHTLTAAEMPAHTHNGPDHTHGMSHGHTANSGGSSAGAFVIPGPIRYFNRGANDGSNEAIQWAGASFHNHGVTVDNFNGNTGGGGTGATSSAGGGQPHNNMPPYVVLTAVVVR